MACNGYLLHQFLSSAINDRADDYNGDLKARARILLEVLAAVRAEVGRDFFVSMKLSGRDEHNAFTAPFVREVGNTIDDTMELSRWLREAGLGDVGRLVDTLLEHDIKPFATLYHWDLPAALEDRAAGRTAATWLGSVRGLCPLASSRTYCLSPGACAWLS